MLELGAGTGVLGGLCAQLGAASVTVTDLPATVPLLELNLLLSFGATATTGKSGGGSEVPVAMALPWGEPLAPAVVERIGGLCVPSQRPVTRLVSSCFILERSRLIVGG